MCHEIIKHKWSKEIVPSPDEIYQLPDVKKANVQRLHSDIFTANGLFADVLRLDKIHPVISGNKWFKLQYYLQQAIAEKKAGIITFGGAWSNHLVATALACRLYNLQATGIVRGTPEQLYAPLQEAAAYGMHLQFADRQEYDNAERLLEKVQQQYPDHLVVPQGGQGINGVKGAATIAGLVEYTHYTHIVCAAGTGTMMAGLVQASLPEQQVTGISSLKFSTGENNSVYRFIQQHTTGTNFSLLYGYHFGGYARYTGVLTEFMNAMYRQHSLPSDFVYTGKLLYAVSDLVLRGYFSPNSRLLIVHSGGLQGNRSLPSGTLCF